MLQSITDLLPVTWRPFAKAIWPALLVLFGTLVYAVQQSLSKGSITLDIAQLETGIVGVLAAGVAFLANSDGVWGRFTKAISAALMTVLILVVHSVVVAINSGDWVWNSASWRVAVSGLFTAAVVALVPNLSLFVPTPDTPNPPDGPDPVVPPGMKLGR